MCVLIICPKGVEKPDITTIMQCKKANPDGFGFCTKDKVFKTTRFVDFLTEFNKLGDEACMIHFRLATHGSVKSNNCHPFVDDASGIRFAHNGVLPIVSKNDKTDSEICFRERLMPVINKYGYGSDEMNSAVLREINTSRFAFMKGDDIRCYGTFHNIDGLYYSNLRWQYY